MFVTAIQLTNTLVKVSVEEADAFSGRRERKY